MVFFTGKGGVGKTTSACAFALGAVRRSASRRRRAAARVLIVSIDPAHSLGDVLAIQLSSAPRRIARGVDAAELDAARAFGRWMRDHRSAVAEIFEHGTWLDASDIDALLDLSIPGVDELAAFLEIARLADDGSHTHERVDSGYDCVVIDTAPTGHLLRLLEAPDTVATVAAVFDALHEEHRLIRDQLARAGGRPDAADQLIALLARQAHDTAALLQNPARTSFHWVTLPEEMSLAESEDGIRALGRAGLNVSDIVVNNCVPDGDACRVCDRRRADERRAIAAIRRRFGRGRTVHVIAARTCEPRGLKALASIAREMGDGMSSAVRRPARSAPPAPSHEPLRGAREDVMRLFRDAALVFFGGKGGVGKTTVSAAAALQLARENPARRVLLLSTDPAHSLADVFREPVGDSARTIAGAPRNLYVRELDAARAFARRREQVEAALGEIAAAIGAAAASSGGVAVCTPSTAASELIDLAPPGIDELFGVLSVVDARDAYGLIIVDAAPTGHALRLLEMPDAAREWMQALLHMLLKYKALVRPGRLAEELVAVSKSIRELQMLLRDAVQTRFIVVTRAADVPRRETERLIARLRRLRLSPPVVVANALTRAPEGCRRCRAIAAAERRQLAVLRRLCGRRCAIIQTPLAAPAPRGARALGRWAHTWVVER